MVIESNNNNNKTKQSLNVPFFEIGSRLMRVDPFLHLCKKTEELKCRKWGSSANRRSAFRNRRYHTILLVPATIHAQFKPSNDSFEDLTCFSLVLNRTVRCKSGIVRF